MKIVCVNPPKFIKKFLKLFKRKKNEVKSEELQKEAE